MITEHHRFISFLPKYPLIGHKYCCFSFRIICSISTFAFLLFCLPTSQRSKYISYFLRQSKLFFYRCCTGYESEIAFVAFIHICIYAKSAMELSRLSSRMSHCTHLNQILEGGFPLHGDPTDLNRKYLNFARLRVPLIPSFLVLKDSNPVFTFLFFFFFAKILF